MRKADLPNCPQWLKDANTEGEQVEWSIGESYVIWLGGVWRGGDWHGGVWHGGDWLGGDSAIRCAWSVRACKNGTISIGCKNKTRKEWDVWFKGTETYSIPRDSWAFHSIYGSYLGLCAWLDAVQKFERKQARIAAKTMKVNAP